MVTEKDDVSDFPLRLAVITEVPAETAVTNPLEAPELPTVATAVAEEVQFAVAVIFCVDASV